MGARAHEFLGLDVPVFTAPAIMGTKTISVLGVLGYPDAAADVPVKEIFTEANLEPQLKEYCLFMLTAMVAIATPEEVEQHT